MKTLYKQVISMTIALSCGILAQKCQAFTVDQYCDVATAGAHLFTQHDAQRRRDLRDVNPGLYAACDSIVGGVFANSVGRTSVYVAKQIPVADRLTLIMGGITGYKAYPVIPMVMLSYKMRDGYRISFFPSTPQNVGGMHVSMDF